MSVMKDELLRNLGLTGSEPDTVAQLDDLHASNERLIGQQIAAMLESEGYHPVIVIGTAGAGKTTLLASLIAGAHAGGAHCEVAIRLGREPLYPTGDRSHKEVWFETRRFYEGAMRGFAMGVPVTSTCISEPIYIPIEVEPTDRRLPPVKLALLEGRGEAFEPVRCKVSLDGSEYQMRQALPERIAGVLRHCRAPVSFIYLAPCKATSASLLEGRIGDLALFQAIDNCQEQRLLSGQGESDQHLLLLSMWDKQTGGVGTDAFLRPDQAKIERVLASDYPHAWRKFLSLSGMGGRIQHYLMQYSAVPFNVPQLMGANPAVRPILDRYPRTVLNWLYTHAQSGRGRFREQGGSGLFRDVTKSSESGWGFVRRVMRRFGIQERHDT